jgi:hypothetical protein
MERGGVAIEMTRDGESTPPENGEKREGKRDARLKWAGLILLLAGLIALVGWGVSVTRAGLSLLGHLSDVRALVDDPQSLDPVAGCELMRGVREDFSTLYRQTGVIARLGPLFGWLPGIGGELGAAPHLLAVGDGLTEAGALTCLALEPALTDLGDPDASSGDFSMEEVARLLDREEFVLEQALAAAERAQAAWDQVDTAQLSPPAAEMAALLDQGLPLLRSGLSAATIAPSLLGVDEPRTYLVLALNEDELRPGGGFISGVGEIKIEAGELTQMTFRDSYAVDDFSQPYPDPPEPLRQYMWLDLWVFRDSNWSPDFPTSAKQAIALYRPGYDVSIDGVIALDQRAVQAFVGAVGPLTIEGADQPIDGERIIQYIREAWAPEGGDGADEALGDWWKQRKSFMGVVAQATWERIQSGRVDWVALGKATLNMLEQKHLLVYLKHPEAAALLAERNWDGALRAEAAGDFMMVVDTNMGYNKVNPYIEKEIVYRCDLRQSPPQSALTLTYTHASSAEVFCRHDSYYGEIYEDMMDRCYWYYARVFVPRESRLVDATQISISGASLMSGEDYTGEVAVRIVDEAPLTSFGVLGLLSTAASQTRSFTWTLPTDVVEWRGDEGWYTLRVPKQPGTAAHPLSVRVRMPGDSVFLDATPTPTSVEAGWITYRTVLDQDRDFTLHFRRMP